MATTNGVHGWMRCVLFVSMLVVVGSVGMVDTSANDTDHKSCSFHQGCRPGVVIPMWEPHTNLSVGDKVARAIVYFAAMAFLFLGVSIIADRFMAAIEVITSKEKEVTVRRPDGETTVVCVRIWNETVSNLTLMALGSSAPEIMLSIIEIIGNGFEAGDLGPSTIVGSAAFNLFVIIGICVFCIPKGEIRRIKHLRVFFITATWSVFAYLWMYLIIAVFSRGIIDVWEGVLTFLFFPATVVTAYIADRKIFIYKFLRKRYRASRSKTVVVTEGGVEMDNKANHVDEVTFKGLDSEDSEVREFERHRKDFIEILRELRRKNPNVDMKSLEEMAELEAMNRGPKSRAFYRIQATRKLTGGGNVIKKSKLERKSSLADVAVEDAEDQTVTRIFFEPGHYTVMENVGTFDATVTRHGGDLGLTIYVDYATEDGSANAGTDYEHATGTLIFLPGEMHKQIPVTIIDDDVFEEDEHFYIRLSNIRIGGSDGMFTSDTQTSSVAQLDNPSMATVMILDDDHCGVFNFSKHEETVTESIGEAVIQVCRASGARGIVKIRYHTLDGTAKGVNKEFEHTSGDIVFENNQTEATIKVRILDGEEYEKDVFFYVVLEEPRVIRTTEELDQILLSLAERKKEGKTAVSRSSVSVPSKQLLRNGKEKESPAKDLDINHLSGDERIAEMGKPRLGDVTKVVVRIRESMEFKSTVDKLIRKTNMSLVVGTSSWREQFIDAMSVSAGDGDDDQSEEKLPSCMDYVMHFLTIFWKILFAFVPPTDMCGAWPTFVVSIFFVGVLTMVIGDVASAFGCTIGMKDAITAITFVAVGTSIPDYVGGWACFTVSIIVIGLLTAVIGDVASSFGCTIGLKDTVTAISFVAIGTSVPDTFASKVAAIGDEYADSSIGNVTGSNAVNVFLGIGIAWTIAAVKHAIYGTQFHVEPGALAFSVTIFVIFAAAAISVMMIRRWHPAVKGELGGPMKYRLPTTIFFVMLWVLYIIISSLESYCHIKGF